MEKIAAEVAMRGCGNDGGGAKMAALKQPRMSPRWGGRDRMTTVYTLDRFLIARSAKRR